jgi:hypothetical protein
MIVRLINCKIHVRSQVLKGNVNDLSFQISLELPGFDHPHGAANTEVEVAFRAALIQLCDANLPDNISLRLVSNHLSGEEMGPETILWRDWDRYNRRHVAAD